jgi:predicted aminopeptidase
VVEIEGTRRWLVAAGRGDETEALDRNLELERLFVALVLEYRGRLDELYRSDRTDADKRSGKVRILEELREGYARARAGWGGDTRYDGWFSRPINNARLASVADYFDLVEPLQALLRASDGDLPTFYERAVGHPRTATRNP